MGNRVTGKDDKHQTLDDEQNRTALDRKEYYNRRLVKIDEFLSDVIVSDVPGLITQTTTLSQCLATESVTVSPRTSQELETKSDPGEFSAYEVMYGPMKPESRDSSVAARTLADSSSVSSPYYGYGGSDSSALSAAGAAYSKYSIYVHGAAAESDDFGSAAPSLSRLSSESGSLRNWNAEFQTAVDELHSTSTPSFEQVERVESIVQAFSREAEDTASQIISGLIPKINIGGIAGVSEGIVYKFIRDPGLYGGIENAMKSASHELRALSSVLSSGIHELRVPLFAILDLAGFRVSAVALLPIDKTTIVYGTDDAGVTVHNDDTDANSLALRLANHLNLKSHFCETKRKTRTMIHTCADLEIHIGRDRRYYVLDAARLMAPTAPLTRNGNEALYHLFRPEFQKKYNVKLSPDSFSGFESIDTRSESSREIYKATQFLLDVQLPKTIHHIASKEINLEALDLSNEFHSHGINMRYLGVARILCIQEYLKEKLPSHDVLQKLQVRLLEEMALRTMKCMFRSRMRQLFLEKDYQLSFKDSSNKLNEVLCEFIDQISSRERSGEFWTQLLPKAMQEKYTFAFTEKETLEGFFDLRTCLDDSRVFRMFLRLFQVQIESFDRKKMSLRPQRVKDASPLLAKSGSFKSGKEVDAIVDAHSERPVSKRTVSNPIDLKIDDSGDDQRDLEASFSISKNRVLSKQVSSSSILDASEEENRTFSDSGRKKREKMKESPRTRGVTYLSNMKKILPEQISMPCFFIRTFSMLSRARAEALLHQSMQVENVDEKRSLLLEALALCEKLVSSSSLDGNNLLLYSRTCLSLAAIQKTSFMTDYWCSKAGASLDSSFCLDEEQLKTAKELEIFSIYLRILSRPYSDPEVVLSLFISAAERFQELLSQPQISTFVLDTTQAALDRFFAFCLVSYFNLSETEFQEFLSKSKESLELGLKEITRVLLCCAESEILVDLIKVNCLNFLTSPSESILEEIQKSCDSASVTDLDDYGNFVLFIVRSIVALETKKGLDESLRKSLEEYSVSTKLGSFDLKLHILRRALGKTTLLIQDAAYFYSSPLQKPMNELDFVYGNQVISSSRLAPRSQSVPWKLKVSLVDSKNEKNMISRLEITWHPSFPNPFTVLTEKDFPFERNGASWGMFTILFEARLIEPFAQEVLCFEHLLTIRGSGLMHSQKVYLVDETMVSST